VNKYKKKIFVSIDTPDWKEIFIFKLYDGFSLRVTQLSLIIIL